MPHLTHGKWVRFPAPDDAMFAGAHRNPDGWAVGIYQKAGVDGLGQHQPERVVVVGPDGADHELDGRTVSLDVARLPYVELADPLRDAPYPRIRHLIATLP